MITSESSPSDYLCEIVPEKRPSMIVENCTIALGHLPVLSAYRTSAKSDPICLEARTGTLFAMGPWRVYVARDLLGSLN